MNKADLITEIAEKAQVTKAVGTRVLDATLESIVTALKAGKRVPLVGFGTFEVRNRAARKGRNPRTGQEIMIPAAKVPSFKAGKKLKETIQ